MLVKFFGQAWMRLSQCAATPEGVDQRMASYPAGQKIWHITHRKNLPIILQCGALWSDAKRLEMTLDCSLVGISKIKERRLKEIEVACHPETMVGQYVPIYFCPRSVMLYILRRGNNPTSLTRADRSRFSTFRPISAG
jgi:hypothetical protein